jgi:DNA-binding transcriptional regulator YdaS (Cro superfamily)
MNHQLNTLEEIHATLTSLRQQVTGRRKFPKELWSTIIRLTKTYSIAEISQRLEISPAYLKRKIHQSQPSPSLDFQEVSIQGPNLGTVVIELDSSSGLRAKIQGPVSCLSCLQSLFGK